MRWIAAIGALVALTASVEVAEAARCKQGLIYRPTQGVCVTKAAMARAGFVRLQRPPKARNVRRVRPPVAVKRAPVTRPQERVPLLRVSHEALRIELQDYVRRNRDYFERRE